MNPVKIYSISPEQHVPKSKWQRYLIHPLRYFYGDGSDEWPEYKRAFEFYAELYELMHEPDKADWHVLPFSINYYLEHASFSLAEQAYEHALAHKKNLLIWIEGDFDLLQHFPQAIYLKNASFRSRKIKNEIIRSGDVRKDLLQQHFDGILSIRPWQPNPLVGFDGLANYPFFRLLALIGRNAMDRTKAVFGWRPFEPPPLFPLLMRRRKLLKRLETEKQVQTHFTYRTNFAQGIRQKDKQARLEFIQNIHDSDYTLCIRGSANYSLRLYETMCLGRIPLFLNTDCVMPFEDQIDWKGAVAWIDESDEKRIAEALLDFHRSLKPREFEERQRYCREIWLKFLSKEGFERSLAMELYNINLKNKRV